MVRLDRITMFGFKSFANKTTIPFPAGFNIVCGPNGSGKSCRGDTEVLLSSGELKPIKEIVENALEKSETHVKLDDGVYTHENLEKLKVLGLDTKNMKVVEKDISAFIRRKGEKELYKIKTKIGRDVTTTGCHPVMVFREGKIVSEVVEKLKEGDLIATPRRLELPENEMKIDEININNDFARFVGYLIGDGYVTFNRAEFVNADEEIIDDFEYLANKFGLKIKYRKKSGKATRLIVWTKEFPTLMKKLLRSDSVLHLTSSYKIIPPEIMLSKKTVIANFLAGLFDCDGTVRKDNPTFEYTTKNEKLANQVQLSLLRFGIVARKEVKMKHATNTKLRKKSAYYFIVIEGKEKLQQLYENIPMRSELKIGRLKKAAEKNVKSGSNIDVLPQETNLLVKNCAKLLGIEYKPLRKKHPWFAAYIENRCCPTRRGIKNAIEIFREKYQKIMDCEKNLKIDKKILLEALKLLNIDRNYASKEIGLNKESITNSWILHNSNPRKANLENLYNYLKSEIISRLENLKEIMSILENLASSDIFWDKIKKIENVSGEEFVYDLTIPNCHNFIGNGIFVHNSNIVDALTFVMGVTSARHIRAHKLQNLLFNGAKDKKPADYCEVSLYLDNSDRNVVGYEKEIKITRRITRSGISIYKLDGHTVTRSKILDSLANANLSPDGWNIIMQGDVTRIIEMSSMERKEIINDISGIAEFQEKRDKAYVELERVENRVRENMIVVAEKQRLVARLKQERENAEKYVSLEKEMRKSKASLIRKKSGDAKEKMNILEKEIKAESEKFDILDKDFGKAEKDLDKKEKELQKSIDEIISKSKNYEIMQKINSIGNEITRKRDKIEINENNIALAEQTSKNEAVKSILSLHDSEVHGTLSSLIDVPEKYSVALEVAVGRHSDDIVVDSEETAARCIKYLKERKVGRARFIPMNIIKPRHAGKCNYKIIGFATELIKYEKKYSPAVDYVLGNTIIVNNIDEAKKIRNFRSVTLDGDLVETSGVMIGGFYRKRKEQRGSTNIHLLRSENSKLEKEISKLEKDLESLRKQEKEESNEVVKLQEIKKRLEEEIEKLRVGRKSSYEERMVLQGSISRKKIDKARLEATLDNLKIEMEDFSDIGEFFDLSQEEMQEKITRCVMEINKLGPVNMKALEEYDILNVEYEELRKKLDKLLQEKEAITNTAQEIEKKRFDKFMETFNEIREHFSRIYIDMTGGSGGLRLEEENNIDSGLMIEASPMGKKVLNIDSLSGGEKTITALAFLFSILQHYASPFYVLDEIDAALDKANTKRMINLIKKYSNQTQFVVISHNDFTIQEADKIFGVSMEDGVSKVFGIEMPTA